MIIILKHDATPRRHRDRFGQAARTRLQSNITHGTEDTIIAAIGTPSLQEKDLVAPQLRAMDAVEKVLYVSKPYKMVSRESHPANTQFTIGDHEDATPIEIGGEKLAIMAGPCSVENLDGTMFIANEVKKAGRANSAWRRLQAAHFALRFPGFGFGGLANSGSRPRRNRSAPSSPK